MVDVLLIVEEGGFPPVRGSLGAACLDLACPCDVVIPPHTSMEIGLKLRFAIPDGVKGELTHRSSLNFKKSMIIPTGTIDSDFRGEVKAKVYNLSDKNQKIDRGERFAQISFSFVFMPVLEVVDSLPETVRGEGGFGSTGTHEIITKEVSDGGNADGASSAVGGDERGESDGCGTTGSDVEGAGDGADPVGNGGGSGGEFDSDTLDSPIATDTPSSTDAPAPARKSVSSRSKKKAAGALQDVPKGNA